MSNPKKRASLRHVASAFFFLIGCNNAPNQVSSRATKYDAVEDKSSVNQEPSTNSPRPPPRFIPAYDDVAVYYDQAQTARGGYAISADVDILLKRVEMSPFVLVEVFEDLSSFPPNGYYKFVLLYINSPGEVYACSEDPHQESAVISRVYPIASFDENLRHLAQAENYCHKKEDSHKYVASHPAVIRFVWSERGKIQEYWVIGSYIFHPRQLWNPPTADCLKLLDRLLEVYRNCKAYF